MFFNYLETDRIVLKNIEHDDREFIFNQFSDDVVNQYFFDAEPLTDLRGADEIIDFYLETPPRNQHRWILVRKLDGVKMGTCGFHCWNRKDASVEIGYDLKKEFWNQGYMTEAMHALLEFAKNQMKIKEITACIYIDNHRSIRLIEKFGFIIKGSKYELFRGKKYMHHVYSLNLT